MSNKLVAWTWSNNHRLIIYLGSTRIANIEIYPAHRRIGVHPYKIMDASAPFQNAYLCMTSAEAMTRVRELCAPSIAAIYAGVNR